MLSTGEAEGENGKSRGLPGLKLKVTSLIKLGTFSSYKFCAEEYQEKSHLLRAGTTLTGKKKWKSLTREEMRLSSDNKSLLHCVQNWNSSDPSLEACLVSLPSMVWITSSSMTNQALESKPLLQTAPRNKRNQWLAPGPLCKAQLLTGTAYCPLCICSWTGDTSQNSLLLQHGMAKPLFQSLCHVAPSNLGFCGLMAG